MYLILRSFCHGRALLIPGLCCGSPYEQLLLLSALILVAPPALISVQFAYFFQGYVFVSAVSQKPEEASEHPEAAVMRSL